MLAAAAQMATARQRPLQLESLGDVSPCVCDMLQKQEACLQAGGYIVRNSFIDTVGDAVDRELLGSRSRRHSEPPTVRSCSSSRSMAIFEDGVDGEMDLDRASDVSKEDSASTRWPSQGGCSQDRSPCQPYAQPYSQKDDFGENVPDDAEILFAEGLKRFVLTNCAFLRISGSSYRSTPDGMPSRSASCRSLPDGKIGATGSLMFFVSGLPWARRAKWLVPLRLCVSKVFEACGYSVFISLGQLYVKDARSRWNYMVKVDFAPALASQR